MVGGDGVLLGQVGDGSSDLHDLRCHPGREAQAFHCALKQFGPVGGESDMLAKLFRREVAVDAALAKDLAVAGQGNPVPDGGGGLPRKSVSHGSEVHRRDVDVHVEDGEDRGNPRPVALHIGRAASAAQARMTEHAAGTRVHCAHDQCVGRIGIRGRGATGAPAGAYTEIGSGTGAAASETIPSSREDGTQPTECRLSLS